MTKLSRKLLISVFTLAFALVTLGATTFAWFTLTSTVQVNQIDLTTSVGYGIEISADNQNYKTFINVEEIMHQLDLYESDGENITYTSFPQLDPVTTADGKNFVDKDLVTKTSGFIKFKLYFRSATPSLPVYFASDTSISSTAESWKPDVDFTYRKAEQSSATNISVYAADAVRFSLEEYTSPSFTTPVVRDSKNAITIWELDPTGRATTEGNELNQRLDQTYKTEDGLFAYWDAKGLVLAAPDEEDFKLPGVLKNSNLGVNGQSVLTLSDTAVSNYYYGYLMVRIWIEGWDPDSFDAIFNSPFSVNLKFAVSEQV